MMSDIIDAYFDIATHGVDSTSDTVRNIVELLSWIPIILLGIFIISLSLPFFIIGFMSYSQVNGIKTVKHKK